MLRLLGFLTGSMATAALALALAGPAELQRWHHAATRLLPGTGAPVAAGEPPTTQQPASRPGDGLRGRQGPAPAAPVAAAARSSDPVIADPVIASLGMPDPGTAGAGMVDAEIPVAEIPVAEIPVAAMSDAGTSDAGTSDAGMVDPGMADAGLDGPVPDPAALASTTDPAGPDAEDTWHAFWTPFRSEASAVGFARHLERVTGAEYRVVRTGPGAYRVAFRHDGDDERARRLTAIERASGLRLPGGEL